MKHFCALALVLLCVGCGSDTPTGPTGQSVLDMAGVWNYSARLSSVAGGECVGAALQPGIGTDERGTMSITQSGANLTATSRSSTDGSSCTYTGTAGSNSFSLGWQTCDAGLRTGVLCSNGARRDMAMVTNSINGSRSGNALTGTLAESFNVSVTGTGASLGALTLNAAFTATK